MNRYLSLALLVLVPLLVTGCDSLLDVDPQQTIATDLALSTPDNVESAVLGAYDQASSNTLYGGYIQMLSDLMAVSSAEVTWSGTFVQPRQFWQKQVLSDNSFVSAIWLGSYSTINTSNNVLASLGVFTSAARRDRAEGHARFIRASMHYELVKLFARDWNVGTPASELGVPVVTSPTRVASEDLKVARNTVAQVYDAVVADLTIARDKLPTTDALADHRALPTTFTASAMLARVHLSRGNFAEAITEASRVINSGRFSLAPTYDRAFNQTAGSPEWIHYIPMSAQDGANDLNVFYGARQNGGRGDIHFTAAFLNRFEASDARRAFFIQIDRNRRQTAKWQGRTADGVDLPLIRLAEMYMIRAEANLRLGTTTGAAPVDDVNVVRARAGASALASVTLTDILDERFREFIFEGHLLNDARRLDGTITVGGTPLPARGDRFVFPIPLREIDANDRLVQNPHYQ